MSTDTQTLDIPKVSAYLEKHLEGFEGPLEVSKFQAGQSNPTFLLKTPSRNYVLRRKPPGVLLKSAHAVDREFRVQKALQDTDVPVSKMHLLCEDDDVIGSAFYIMDHIDGRNFMDPRMPDMDKAGRAGVIDEMNRVLAALHEVDIDAVGLSDYGPPGNYYERQVARWTKQYRASETEDLPAMNQLIEKLTASIPADDGQRTLVHGDYRLDNLLFAPQGTACVAVLDWELSTLGHPLADLAYCCIPYHLPQDDTGTKGLVGIDLEKRGIPSEGEFIRRYCNATGRDNIVQWPFYVAFSMFRLAAILQGVYARAIQGNASSANALTVGARAALLATTAAKLVS